MPLRAVPFGKLEVNKRMCGPGAGVCQPCFRGPQLPPAGLWVGGCSFLRRCLRSAAGGLVWNRPVLQG